MRRWWPSSEQARPSATARIRQDADGSWRATLDSEALNLAGVEVVLDSPPAGIDAETARYALERDVRKLCRRHIDAGTELDVSFTT